MSDSPAAQRLREIVEVCINGHDPDAIDRYTANPHVRGSIHSIVGGFPDVHVDIQWMMGDGSKAAYFGSLRGTHLGPYLQATIPTGRTVEAGVMVAYEFDDELQVIDMWLGMNFLSVLDQLGYVRVLETPEP